MNLVLYGQDVRIFPLQAKSHMDWCFRNANSHSPSQVLSPLLSLNIWRSSHSKECVGGVSHTKANISKSACPCRTWRVVSATQPASSVPPPANPPSTSRNSSHTANLFGQAAQNHTLRTVKMIDGDIIMDI